MVVADDPEVFKAPAVDGDAASGWISVVATRAETADLLGSQYSVSVTQQMLLFFLVFHHLLLNRDLSPKLLPDSETFQLSLNHSCRDGALIPLDAPLFLHQQDIEPVCTTATLLLSFEMEMNQ